MGAVNEVPTDTKLLRMDQLREMRQEQQAIDAALDPSLPAHARPTDPGALRKARRRIDEQVARQTPPELKGEVLDDAISEEQELREELVQGMPSHIEMRRNPPGVVGRHRAWQKRVKALWRGTGQSKINRWKNLRRAIARSTGRYTEDPDVANLEQYRPTVPYGNLDGAQIPGQNFNFPSEQYQQNHDDVFGAQRPADEPLTERPSDPKCVSRCDRFFRSRSGRASHEAHCDECKALAASVNPPPATAVT